MKLIIDDQFRDMCREIVRDYDAQGEASLFRSDDLYQLDNFCGGWSDESRRATDAGPESSKVRVARETIYAVHPTRTSALAPRPDQSPERWRRATGAPFSQ